MRDYILIATLLFLAPLALRFPFVGVYLWVWLSLMNPHRLAYGFAQYLPLNVVVAALTVIGCIFSSERMNFKVTPMVALFGAFSIWITLTTFLAPAPDFSWPLWDRNIKTMLLLFMVMALITNRTKLDGLIWIVVISLAYYGVKGGGFMILSGGNYRVFGPVRSMIEDNNGLALALIITLPLTNYLRMQAENRFIKMGLAGVMVLTLAAIIGTYSRGGVVAMGAMLVFMWLKSRAKFVTGVLAVVTISTAFFFMPAQYLERINTVAEFQTDGSFQGRVDAWDVAIKTASDNLFGAGFDGPRQQSVWNRYRPDAQARASHSIYFMVLGEHGFIGLGLYLSICLLAWRNLSRTLSWTRDQPSLLWARDLASALQIAMVGFMIGGALLPMAYYDGFLIIIAISACLVRIVQESVSRVDEKSHYEPLTAVPRMSPRHFPRPAGSAGTR